MTASRMALPEMMRIPLFLAGCGLRLNGVTEYLPEEKKEVLFTVIPRYEDSMMGCLPLDSEYESFPALSDLICAVRRPSLLMIFSFN